MRFRVWAPSAERVDLVLRDERIEMRPLERGCWEASAEASDGDRYGYSLDGGEPLPDPRGHALPEGIEGLSAVVDHSIFDWSDVLWVPETLERWVIYELHIGTFTEQGTFEASVERLDHLVDLGVTAVEVMPVNTFSGEHGWGYDGVGLWAPHHAYGGPVGFKRFVDACHARGLAVILDVVYNHLGPAGNHLPRFGPYFTDTYSTPWGDAINFDDAGSDGVRDFVIGNALYWMVHYHVDGLRLDAIHAFLDRSAKHILEELSERTEEMVERLGRPIYLIAESDLNDPRVITPRDHGGFGMDAQWTDDIHHSIHAALTGERDGYYEDFGAMQDLATALTQGYVYSGRYSPYRDRAHGRPATGLSGRRFVAYAQNHDQIGNRAQGDRLGRLVDEDLLKVAAAMVLASPFTPLLFMGEEWNATTPFQYFTNHADPELGRAVSRGRREEFSRFGWDPAEVPDPQDRETFLRSKLSWQELEDQPHADMLDWYRSLIRLRFAEPTLLSGDLSAVEVEFSEEERWLVLRRGPFTFAYNLSDGDVVVPAAGSLVMASGKDPAIDGDKASLPPRSVSIFRTQFPNKN
ncbi:MAG: malto-oligosyltrehalose trehalohydrolase [Actinomycetota bacterium]